MGILEVKNLKKSYGKGENKVNAVDDISFSVNEGEFVAIIGASGSGKSTLLHLLGGVDRPTSGTVKIKGTDIYKLKSDNLAIFRRRNIGIIYQFYNLIPILNVEENIALPCELDGKNVDSRKMDDLLQTLKLKDRKKHLPNELSGGQQQRVSIGRAIINNPSIMLADEPTGALDSKSAKMLLERLDYLNNELSATILMVTHDAFTASYASRVVFIKDGRLFKEIHRGKDTRKEFFDKIIDVVTLLGGDLSDAL